MIIRDTKRHRKRLPLKFGCGVPTRVGFTEDISLQGLCIKTAFVSPPGTHLNVELSLPDGSLVQMTGVVVWTKKVPPNMVQIVKKCGMGLRVAEIQEGKEKYVRLCSEMLSR